MEKIPTPVFHLMLIVLFTLVSYSIDWTRRNVCFRHRKIKTRVSYYPQVKAMHCSSCAEEVINQIRCHQCGWSGSVIKEVKKGNHDLFCPNCHGKIKS